MSQRKYAGILKKRIEPLTLLDFADTPDAAQRRTIKLGQQKDREEALFAHFGIDDRSRTKWRELALALAGAHVPAFMPKPGRPAKNDDEDNALLLVFAYVISRDECSDRRAFEVVAEISELSFDQVSQRLKDFKKRKPDRWRIAVESMKFAGKKARRPLSNNDLAQMLKS